MKHENYEVTEDGLYKILECHDNFYIKELILSRVVFEDMMENWGKKNEGDNANEVSS